MVLSYEHTGVEIHGGREYFTSRFIPKVLEYFEK